MKIYVLFDKFIIDSIYLEKEDAELILQSKIEADIDSVFYIEEYDLNTSKPKCECGEIGKHQGLMKVRYTCKKCTQKDLAERLAKTIEEYYE